MDEDIKKVKSYFRETLNFFINPISWDGEKNLPVFMKTLYRFYTILLVEKLYLLVVDSGSDEITPGALRKHLDYLHTKIQAPCIYVSASVPPYNLKRLIAHRIQFIVPGKQIHLPGLGIDLLESPRGFNKKHPSDQITPATQTVIIYALLHPNEREFTLLELAKALDYSPMTMTRVFNELESNSLGKIIRNEKIKKLIFPKDSALLWQQAKPFMQSPVKKRIWIKSLDIQKIKQMGSIAGLSALSELSMISSSECPTYALSLQSWKNLQKSCSFQEIPLKEDANIELEIWNFDPILFAKKGIVDYFSLFLSLKENQDERILAALEQLMKDTKW